MAKHTLTKWVIGLSSVVAFTGFVGLSKQADATKAAAQSADVQMQPIAPAAQQPASQTIQPEIVTKKSLSIAQQPDIQPHKEEKKYTSRKEDNEKHYKRKHEEKDDDGDNDSENENKRPSVQKQSITKRSTKPSSSYTVQETVKKPVARSRAS